MTEEKTFDVLGLSPTQLLMIVVGGHVISHHPLVDDDDDFQAEWQSLKKKAGDAIPEDVFNEAVEISTDFASISMMFMECVLIRQIWDVYETFRDLQNRQALQMVEELIERKGGAENDVEKLIRATDKAPKQ